MTLLTDNLLVLVIVGLVLVVASFVRVCLVSPQWKTLAAGAVFLLLAAVGVAKVLLERFHFRFGGSRSA